ncbi:MAG: phage minor head protein, partial [Gammaproteobacteria bacterium]|nr:phage minor head protein [Gammaproteobacteria bacterium]
MLHYKYFREKDYLIADNWTDVWQEQHARAFTVAKAAKLSVLREIRIGLDKALADGITEREFIKTLKPRLKKMGWWGKDELKRQLGSTRRLKTIFRTNMASSYNAGRYREQKRQAELKIGAAPWWQYVAVLDQRTRDQHRALDGKVFRHDDPFWTFFYPPNGFNCRCRVRTLTDAMLKKRKLKPESSEGKLSWRREKLLDRRTGVFTRPSKRVRVFRGKDVAGRDFAVSPHAGFDYNPGQAWGRWSPDVRVAAPGKPADFR